MTTNEPIADSHSRVLLKDAALIFLFMVAAYVLAARFDIYEGFLEWSRGYEDYNLDEAPILIFALAIGLVWFAYRRWREYANEAVVRKGLEEEAQHIRKMEAVGQLTGGIAHDFSNLLTIVQGNLEILNEEGFSSDDRAEMTAEALAAAQRGTELTRRLLAFARRQPLIPRPMELGVLVRGLEDLLRRTLGSPIGIETTIFPDLWYGLADPILVENALLNLALNARDAMSGGGIITIETANVSIGADEGALEELAAGDYVTLRLTDTGCGMSEEVKDRAFDPFFTTKPVGKGTGLGLSTVYGFARQSGGTLHLESVPGQGTTVTLYLPRTLEAPAQETPQSNGGQVGGSASARILIAEDDVGVRRHAARLLTHLGYEVALAQNGREALAILKKDQAIDLLFTDVLMPGGMDGYELARQALAMRPDLKILMTSAHPDHLEAGSPDSTGATGGADITDSPDGKHAADTQVLRKPYKKDELAQRVRAALEG